MESGRVVDVPAVGDVGGSVVPRHVDVMLVLAHVKVNSLRLFDILENSFKKSYRMGPFK
jgi:hypothetical protein